METKTAVLAVMTDLKQKPNTLEQNTAEHLPRNKDHSREEQRKGNQQVGKEGKKIHVGNLHETMTESIKTNFLALG